MSEEQEKKPNRKQQIFIDEYLKCWNAAEAARRAGYSANSAREQGHDLLQLPHISSQIHARLDEVHMSADEALKILSDIAHADLGVFWKIIDEWMFNPLPEYEILDEREVIDESTEPATKRISYRVRHVALDMDKVTDPRYSHLIQEFSDSRRSGLSIKTYSRHDAIRDVLKIHGRFAPEKIDLSNSDGSLNVIRIIEHKDE